jgi:hypothetical protein
MDPIRSATPLDDLDADTDTMATAEKKEDAVLPKEIYRLVEALYNQ